jgi:SAM-dependent methyltransferase
MENKYKDWSSYYAGYRSSFSNMALHYPYLLAILFQRPKTILEIGCGSADHSMFLKKYLPKIEVSLLDNDQKILDSAKFSCKNNISNSYYVDILNKSEVQSIPRFDVVMSQGLMEHFDDSQFIQIVDNFRGKAGVFIFSIPSDQYPTLDFGNEILRSKNKISDLLSCVSNIRFSVANYWDIGLRTKLLGARKKVGIIEKLKYIFLRSNHILVKVSYS